MFILRTQEDVTQIGVGLIKKVQGNPCSSEACFDIIFYAPKGAKSQAGKKMTRHSLQQYFSGYGIQSSLYIKRSKRLKKKIQFWNGM